MRLLAVGDVHGCLAALETLAATVPFGVNDHVVTLGDYVDRGPDSRGVLEWLVAFQSTGRLIPLRGNHEIMMMDAVEAGVDDARAYLRWLACGGEAAAKSYGDLNFLEQHAGLPEAHWRFLQELRPYHESDTHLFVHANVDPELPLAEQEDDVLFWEHYRPKPPHVSGKVVVCGHTPQKSGQPLWTGSTVCIDTFACGGGWLTCLDPASGMYWQANQRREVRGGRLFEPA
ncbi:MAG: metallophosphoesterase family protein [Planctomycetia bacterium]